MRLVTLLVAALLFTPSISHAQGISIFLKHDRLAEYSAGAGLNLLSRGPWIDKHWRRPLIRFAGTQITSYAYERLFDYNGFNWSDYRQRLYGYVLTEVVIDLGKVVVKKVF